MIVYSIISHYVYMKFYTRLQSVHDGHSWACCLVMSAGLMAPDRIQQPEWDIIYLVNNTNYTSVPQQYQFTTTPVHHSDTSAPEQYQYTTTIPMHHNNTSAPQQYQCTTTIPVHHNNTSATQQYQFTITIPVHHNNTSAPQQYQFTTTIPVEHNDTSLSLFGEGLVKDW